MMPALIRAYGAALKTSRALPTPGRGQWPLHPQTRPKHQAGVRVIRARSAAVLAGSPCPANEGYGADQLAGVLI